MKREIKFRAWLKKLKKMVVVNDLTFNKHESYPVGVNDCGHIDCTTCLDWYELEDVELMQYTGLKDKNGVEIYEGDVYRYKYLVLRDSFSYRFAKIEWDIAEIAYEGSFFGYNFNHEEIEVIGNIYENPELLKGGITC